MTNYHYKIDIEDTIVVEIGKELHLLYKMNVTLPDERALYDTPFLKNSAIPNSAHISTQLELQSNT